jgi:hypothetical protein
MVVLERMRGQSVRIGRYTLRILTIRPEEVVVALLDPEKDCAGCGVETTARRRCPSCAAEALVCPDCAETYRCRHCALHTG